MNDRHTPTPWNWHEQGEANEYCLLTNDKRWVISFRQNGELMPAEQRANAEFIVRACNAHDDLMKALKSIVDCFDIESGMVSDACVNAARAAIAKLPNVQEVKQPYNAARIAWELERTAMGDGFYGNALHVAKDIPGITDEDRALLNRFASGDSWSKDAKYRFALQDLAMRIDALAKATT